MRRTAIAAAVLLLAMTAACGTRPDDGVAVAAGASLEPVPVPTTASTTTTTAAAPATTTTRPAPPATTAPPRTTVATAAPRRQPYAPPPPPPGVVADGYGGYGGIATIGGADATVAVSLYPREQYFGEPVQLSVKVTTTEYVRSVRVDMGNGATVDLVLGPNPGTCTRQPRDVSGSAPYYVYPAPGQFVVKATATIVTCVPMAGPPELPPGVPSPFPADQHTVEASISLNQRADRPPPPVGPPPGA